MSILQDNDFLERMLLSLGIPAIFSAAFFVWWLIDGAPEPQAQVSASRSSAPAFFESAPARVDRATVAVPVVQQAEEVVVPPESAAAVAPGEVDIPFEEDDPEVESERVRFNELDQQFTDELRRGRRAPQSAEFLQKELSERFARLASIEIDSHVICTGSVCQVTLASTESPTTLVNSSSGTIEYLLPGHSSGPLSDSGAAEARARYQARSEVPPGKTIESVRFLVSRESLNESLPPEAVEAVESDQDSTIDASPDQEEASADQEDASPDQEDAQSAEEVSEED